MEVITIVIDFKNYKVLGAFDTMQEADERKYQYFHFDNIDKGYVRWTTLEINRPSEIFLSPRTK